MKIGPFIIMRAADHPAFLTAEKLARCLSANGIDDILAGRKHLILGKLNIDNPSDPMNKETLK